MVVSESLRLLLILTLSSSLGIVLALTLRRPMRHLFGAAVGYATWLLVPAAIVASLLPSNTLHEEVLRIVPALGAPSQVASATAIKLSASVDGVFQNAVLVLWLLGVGLAVFITTRAHRDFLRGLGTLQLRDSFYFSNAADSGLPATLGLWRPRIVLPNDFELRFDTEQRSLMLAHERCHIARGDPWINVLVALFRCVFWFNPLSHFGAACLRQDQELACDAAVLTSRPQDRRRYGETLLQAQLVDPPALLGCHFGFGHPLKERILMLRFAQPSFPRRCVGLVVLALTTISLATAVSVAQGRNASYQPVKEIQSSRQNHPPRYPIEAIRDGISGTVTVLADIDEHGHVVGARIERSEPAGVFDAASLQAVAQWQFEPAMRDGVAIREEIRIPITFEVTDESDLAAD